MFEEKEGDARAEESSAGAMAKKNRMDQSKMDLGLIMEEFAEEKLM